MSFSAKNVIKSMVARGLVENGCIKFTLLVDASTDVVELSQSGALAPGNVGAGIADALRSGSDKSGRLKIDKKALDNKAVRRANKKPAEAPAPAKKPATPERQHAAIRGR